MEAKLARIKELIRIKEETDAELEALIAGSVKARKPQACSVCHAEGHTSRTCPTKTTAPAVQ